MNEQPYNWAKQWMCATSLDISTVGHSIWLGSQNTGKWGFGSQNKKSRKRSDKSMEYKI